MTIKNKTNFLSSPIIIGALTLGFSGVLCKIIGGFYRVPLTFILGSVGMGLYGLIFPIYSLLLVISSSAFPVALSKIIAQNRAKQNYGFIKKLIKVSFAFLFCLGLVLSLFLVIFAKNIASMQGASDGYLSFIAIAPSIFIVALICVYRGIFQGYNNMTPTGTSQLLEQLIKVIFGLILAYFLLPFGVVYGVTGALLGVTISEFTALIYLKIKYKHFKFVITKAQDETYKTWDTLKILIKTAFPITLSGIVIPLFLVLESFLCVNLLTSVGQDNLLSISEFGLYSGVVNTLINVPIVVLNAIAISTMPIITASFAKQNKSQTNKHATKCINLCLFIGIPCVLLFALYPKQIIGFLYPSLSASELITAYKLLALSSSTALSLGLFYASSLLLQAIEKNAFPIINSIIFSTIRVVLYVVLMRYYGILALSITSTIIYLLMCVVNILYLKKFIIIKSNTPLKIFAFSLIFIILSFIIYYSLYAYLGGFAFIVSIIISGLVYILLNFNNLANIE